MRTEDLIAAMAADPKPAHAVGRTVVLALAGGAVLSLVGLLATMGLRTDLRAAFATWRFDLKLVLIGFALVLALVDCLRLASPLARGFGSRLSLLIPVLLIAAVAVELASVPAPAWGTRLVGTNALVCLTAIPALSLAPLLAGLAAMRSGAPASASVAGAAVGRLAAAAAASLYALHCFDDSPLFVVTWYTLATLPVIALGAWLGRRALRW